MCVSPVSGCLSPIAESSTFVGCSIADPGRLCTFLLVRLARATWIAINLTHRVLSGCMLLVTDGFEALTLVAGPSPQ